MFGILVFLFLLSLLLTHFNYRLSLFMFPDGVYINKFQGFLGWYGFTNLFVSIPFLWDGDFKQGVFPFVLGVVPLIIAIISVFRLNTNVNVQYRRGLKVLSNADANMVEPGKYKDASMLSASVQYKAKWAVWKLTGENLLDVRQYTRTLFMDTDRFVHTTNLVGRTVMLTCKLLLAGNK